MKLNISSFFLFPLSLIFGLIVNIRNFLYDKSILKSRRVNVPTICIGNLAVGGTGKTPHTEFLLSRLQDDTNIAVLSRGYKRKTKGFQFASKKSTSEAIGDEPFQIHKKFPDVLVAVDEQRVHGIESLLQLKPDLELVILDDAFQHRKIRSGFSILLTEYAKLYTDDFYLPYGRLRESKRGSKRADLIIVTKCPKEIKEKEMLEIEKKLKPLENQELFFSSYQYEKLKAVFPSNSAICVEQKLTPSLTVLLLAGIVSPQKISDYLKPQVATIETLFYPDHHHFSKKDYALLQDRFVSLKSKKKIIIVTEKDAARILSDPNYPEELKKETFSLPISVKILNNKEDLLIQKIQNYVTKNSRNSKLS